MNNADIAATGSWLEHDATAEQCQAWYMAHRKATGLVCKLALIAQDLASAKRHRLAGRIDMAQRFEASVSTLHKSLPDEARW